MGHSHVLLTVIPIHFLLRSTGVFLDHPLSTINLIGGGLKNSTEKIGNKKTYTSEKMGILKMRGQEGREISRRGKRQRRRFKSWVLAGGAGPKIKTKILSPRLASRLATRLGGRCYPRAYPKNTFTKRFHHLAHSSSASFFSRPHPLNHMVCWAVVWKTLHLVMCMVREENGIID
jgi:hypothetical protein